MAILSISGLTNLVSPGSCPPPTRWICTGHPTCQPEKSRSIRVRLRWFRVFPRTPSPQLGQEYGFGMSRTGCKKLSPSTRTIMHIAKFIGNLPQIGLCLGARNRPKQSTRNGCARPLSTACRIRAQRSYLDRTDLVSVLAYSLRVCRIYFQRPHGEVQHQCYTRNRQGDVCKFGWKAHQTWGGGMYHSSNLTFFKTASMQCCACGTITECVSHK